MESMKHYCILFFIIVGCGCNRNDLVKYNEKMKVFGSNEIQALKIFDIPLTTPKDTFLVHVKDSGIYLWEENIKILTELEKLNLPDTLHEKNKILIDYCNLRIKSYNLLYKRVEENTEMYKDSIADYDTQIRMTLYSLTEI